jgi:hypothetical protein
MSFPESLTWLQKAMLPVISYVKEINNPADYNLDNPVCK